MHQTRWQSTLTQILRPLLTVEAKTWQELNIYIRSNHDQLKELECKILKNVFFYSNCKTQVGIYFYDWRLTFEKRLKTKAST